MTYGDYIKTREAQIEANRDIREHIRIYTKNGDRNVVKMKMGKPGTLNYGRAVVMFIHKTDPRMLKIKPNYKPFYTILSMDYGLLPKLYPQCGSKGNKRCFEQWIYKSKAAAEKKFASEVRMMSYGNP